MTVVTMKKCEVGTNTTFEVLQRQIDVDPAALTAQIGDTLLKAGSLTELRTQLSATIYTHFHIRNPDINSVPVTDHQDLAAALVGGIPHRSVLQSAAALSPARATVQGHDHEIVDVGGVKVLFPPQDVHYDSGGNVTAVRVPSWRSRTTPGFLLALGDGHRTGTGATSRLYITCDSAAEALAIWPAVIGALSASGLNYQVKALSSSFAYPRSDAIVAYVPEDSILHLVATLVPIVEELPPPKTPASIFTRRFSSRLSAAEEPSDHRPSHRGLSFGQHRSRVLADALLRSATEGVDLHDSWKLEAIAAGIELQQPIDGSDDCLLRR